MIRYARMIKAITFIKRKKASTAGEFQDYWRRRHADVIRQLPGVRRYVQNHPLPGNYEHGEPPYDGIAELWADDTRAFQTMAGDPAYAVVQGDEQAFLERRSLDLIIASEHTVITGPLSADGIKLIDFFRRKRGMSVDYFQHYWRDVHGPLLNRLTRLRRYVQSPVRPGGYTRDRTPVYDGMSSIWFDSLDDLHQTLNSDVYADIMEDRKNFIDARISIVCKEHVLIG